ncbi:MAG: hypothetical protein RDU20_18035 [Desulfomonilaceae bacterium]|nr:hypothetical protein [Desulfomonilaceae bacterium]
MRSNKPRFRMKLRLAKAKRLRRGVEITAGLPSNPVFFFKKKSLNDLRQ